MGCRRKNTLCLSLDFGANDGTLLPRLTRLETSPSPQKRLVLKFPTVNRPRTWRVISTISPPKLPKRTEVLPRETKLKQKATSSEQTKNTNDTYLSMCVLSDRAITFWTKPYLAGVR